MFAICSLCWRDSFPIGNADKKPLFLGDCSSNHKFCAKTFEAEGVYRVLVRESRLLFLVILYGRQRYGESFGDALNQADSVTDEL
jgi:hypothetical protein